MKKNNRQISIKTPHGIIKCPVFMPDATRASIKILTGKELESAQVDAMVVNTFHLYLQPGLKVIKKAGGVHAFMNWHRPLVSDSGGFQVFSLIHKNAVMGKIYDDRVAFKSPIDGSKHELTPEKSIQIQFVLGTDIMICLDDCPPNNINDEEMAESVARTIAWAKRCRVEFDKQIKKRKLVSAERPKLFSVIQGGLNMELRQYCAKELVAIGFDGYGFGARPVDADGNYIADIIEGTARAIPENCPRFALGVGTPEHIKKTYQLGWDIFDCVIPTREGRHGKMFQFRGDRIDSGVAVVNIKNSKYAGDLKPINSKSNIPDLKKYSKAYLHHLFKVSDPLAQRLASLNNLEYFNRLMKGLKSK